MAQSLPDIPEPMTEAPDGKQMVRFCLSHQHHPPNPPLSNNTNHSQVFLGLTRAEVLALTTWQWPQPYLEHIRHAAQDYAAAIDEEDDNDEDEDGNGVVEEAATRLRDVVKEEAARLREVFSLGGLLEDVEKVFMGFLAKALT
jgi:hypothetical protein